MAEISKVSINDTDYLLKSVSTQGIPYGDVTSDSTTVFTATVPGITELRQGTCCLIRNNNKQTSASGWTLNVNDLGAKPVYNNMADATRDTTIFNKVYTMLFVYDEDRVDGGCWICYRGYNSDTNTIGYQLRTNSTVMNVSDTARYYKLYFMSADNTKWVPASVNSTNSATSAKTVNQRPINPFGRIVYTSASTNYTAGSNLAATTIWDQYALSLGYSFNRTGAAPTMTIEAPVYVKCAPQADGSAIMDATTPIVQALPSTADGKIYIYLGVAYSATNIELVPHHPVYYHDGTAIRIWTGASGGSSSVAWNDITGKPTFATVATSGDYDDLSNKPTIPSAVTESTVAGWGFTKNTGTYSKPSGGIPKTDLASAVQTSLGKADTALQSYTETDPTVPSWAKASSKPTYTASEVGALPDTTAIPTNTSDLTNDSGFITGMTILSYGNSTWADFEAAYNANKVVYCRASSNANPASGSQTRLAFMAYVNNATTPTNVEFQYYRSVSTHTASQQGDQVFVYKLDKTSGWSVTVREAYTKIVAGTGLDSSYANGALSLTCDLSDLGVTATATELNYTDGVTSNIQDQLDAMASAVSFTAAGTIASFVDGEGGKAFVDLVANIEPVQSGSGDPSPSNIRPISGWTGVNVTRAGKNLFDINKMVNTAEITVSNGVIYVYGNSRNSTKKLGELADLIVGESYTLSATSTGGNNIIYLYGTGANITWNFGTSKTITQAMLNALVFFYGGSGTGEITNFMIRPASVTDATFEPYTSETISVDWTSEAGTVYGGMIDVATGLLTVTNGYIASYNGEALPSTWISDRDVYSSGTTPTTGAQVVYALANPQTYQLTPRDVYTLLGTNNVWADTGDITVRYIDVASDYFVDKSAYKSGQLLQDKNLAYVESGTRASRAYSVNNYFINANGVLCRITASVSSGGTLIQGTNYIVVTGGLANDLYSLLS